VCKYMHFVHTHMCVYVYVYMYMCTHTHIDGRPKTLRNIVGFINRHDLGQRQSHLITYLRDMKEIGYL
jgi:hypothetical protein